MAGSAIPKSAVRTQATYDLIKRELFRRAAPAQGQRPGGLRPLCRRTRTSAWKTRSWRAENSSTRRGQPAPGSLALDLPPGGGGWRRAGRLRPMSIIRSSRLRTAVARLSSCATPTRSSTPLATLARVAQPAPQPAAPTESATNEVTAEQPDDLAPLPSCTAPPASPSFNCANAQNRGEPRGLQRPRPRGARSQHGRAISAAQSGVGRPARHPAARRATASSISATAARTATASPTLTPAACAKFATSWKGAGSRPDDHFRG